MGLSVAAQLALGFLLSEDDFGTYAIAIAVANLVQVVRDGGARLIATRQNPTELPKYHRALVRHSLIAAILAAGIALVAGTLAADAYALPEVFSLVAWISASIPLGFYAPVGFGILNAQLRFRRLVTVQTQSAFIRQVLTVSLAAVGFGPFSFVVPLILVNSFESISTWLSVRSTIHSEAGRTKHVSLNRPLLLSALGAWLTFAYLNVDTLVLGSLISVSTIGYYFFGYQLVLKTTGLLDAMRNVLIPAFSQRGLDSVILARTASLTTFVSGSLAVILILASGPVLDLIWGSRWSLSSATIIALASTIPFFSLARLLEMASVGAGRIGLWNQIVGIRILGVVAGATIGGVLNGANPAPTSAAVGVAIGIVVSSILAVLFAASRLGVSSHRLSYQLSVASPVLVSAALAATALLRRTGFSSRIILLVGGGIALVLIATPLLSDRQLRADVRRVLVRRNGADY